MHDLSPRVARSLGLVIGVLITLPAIPFIFWREYRRHA